MHMHIYVYVYIYICLSVGFAYPCLCVYMRRPGSRAVDPKVKIRQPADRVPFAYGFWYDFPRCRPQV